MIDDSILIEIPEMFGLRLGKEKPRLITSDEIEKHKTPDSIWVIFHGKVYDVTDFAKDHPGGTRLILVNAGMDITRHEEFHSKRMKEILKPRLIGKFQPSEEK